MVKQFLTLYTPERATWTNITELTDDLRWTEMTAQTAAEFFDSHNVLHRFSREVIEAATRVNYGQVCFALLTLLTPKKNANHRECLQNVDEIHAVEGQVSLAADNAVGVKGGNFQIFQNFLARSGAKVHLNTTVSEPQPYKDASPRLNEFHVFLFCLWRRSCLFRRRAITPGQ